MIDFLDNHPLLVEKRKVDNRKGKIDPIFDWVVFTEWVFKVTEEEGELSIFLSETPVPFQWTYTNSTRKLQHLMFTFGNGGPKWSEELLEKAYKEYSFFLKRNKRKLTSVFPRRFKKTSKPFVPSPSLCEEHFAKLDVLKKNSMEEMTQQLEETPIEYLQLSLRTQNILKKHNCPTIGKIFPLTKEELTAMPQLGTRSVKEVLATIESLHKRFYI